TVRTAAGPQSFAPFSYLFVLLAVTAAVGVGELLWPWIGLENIGLVFLTAVVGVAIYLGLGPSLLASFASALSFNYFFTEPYQTFAISNTKDVIATVFFTAVALLGSHLAAPPPHQP